MSSSQLRPLGLGEILEVGIGIYRQNFRALVTLVALLVTPFEIASGAIQAATLSAGTFLSDPAASNFELGGDVWLAIGGFAAAILLVSTAVIVATGACYHLVAHGYLGERRSGREALGYATRRLHSILWVTSLGSLLGVLGLLLLIVPGIYLFVAFSVAVPVLLTEGVKGRRALGRSRRLVKGRWWPTLGVLFLGGVLVSVVQGGLVGLTALFTSVDTADPTPGSFAANTLARILATALATPLLAAFVAVLYFDLRVRKEDLDLDRLAEELGLEPGERVSPAARAARPALRPEDLDPDDQPPFWPPPPGWKPRSERDPEG